MLELAEGRGTISIRVMDCHQAGVDRLIRGIYTVPLERAVHGALRLPWREQRAHQLSEDSRIFSAKRLRFKELPGTSNGSVPAPR